jgi:AraC-like DNA-binding protein
METVETYSLAMGTDVVCRILGIDPVQMLAVAGLAGVRPHRGELRVSAKQYFAAWNAIERLTADPDYVMRLGVAIARGPLIPAFFALSCAPDLETGSTRLSHFKALIGPSKMRVIREDGILRIEYVSANPHLDLPPSLGALHLVYSVEAVRGATAHPMRPIAAQLNAPEVDRRRIAGHLGILPDYGEVAALTWAAEDAKRPFVSENLALWADFEKDLSRQLAARNARILLSVRVKATLIDLLPTGRSSADDVCDAIGISRSTLQRRLKDEGLAFQAVLDDLRREIALRYITKSTLRADEIAAYVGYHDANSFSRRFRHWTGMSPLEFRAHQAARPKDGQR